jgi:3-oxoacyl-[acyl-carrier protein] reductase
VDLGIEGRTALVMAASKGIGRGIADVLAQEGARVAISSRSEEELRKAAAEIDGEVEVFPADTGDLDRLGELPGEVSDALGQIEILVLNTGGPPYGAALDNSIEEWEAAFRSLVLAPRVLAEGVLPGMRELGWGRIVNVSSTSIREPIPALTLSNANRMAALGLLKTLADEVAGEGVTVNTVATGMFATERLADPQGSLEGAEELARQRVPAKRLGRPEEYGDLIAFLCSERAAYLTGAVIPLDGGLLRSV